MAWENANQIFRGQLIQLPNNLGTIYPEDLPLLDINSVSVKFIKPVRHDMIENILSITAFRDNSVIKKYEYNILPEECIDGIPMFNIFGYKIFEDEKDGYNDTL